MLAEGSGRLKTPGALTAKHKYAMDGALNKLEKVLSSLSEDVPAKKIAQADKAVAFLRAALNELDDADEPEKDAREEMARVVESLKRNGFVENKDFFPWNKAFRLHDFDSEEAEPLRVYDRNGSDLGAIYDCSILFREFAQKSVFMWRIYARKDAPRKDAMLEAIKTGRGV